MEKRKCCFKGKEAWSHFRCSSVVKKLLRFQWSVQKHEMFVRQQYFYEIRLGTGVSSY
jgi:hypothetical protein